MICVGIYAVLVENISLSGDNISGAIWGCMGYTVLCASPSLRPAASPSPCSGRIREAGMEKKYNVIYGPALVLQGMEQEGCGPERGKPLSHHMSIEAIKAAPVSRIAAGDCALFLWITFPMLREGWAVMDAWGFTFKTVAFVWVKQCRKSDNIFTGMGYWTRANAEICLLATRGRETGGQGCQAGHPLPC